MRFLGGTQTTAIGRPRTFLAVVLDASGSMISEQKTTIQAYNDFIARQRAASEESKDEVFVTLVQFSDARRVHTIYNLKPLQDVQPLTTEAYRPDGDTALYDGIWHAISEMEQAVGENARVLLLAITDGEENASRTVVDIDQLKGIIQSREERGNWTFVFLSAGSNPYQNAQGMGFKSGNVQTYQAGSVGTALARVDKAVASYRKGDQLSTETFWHGKAQAHDTPDWVEGKHDADVPDVV